MFYSSCIILINCFNDYMLFLSIIIRILSNPIANVIQKKLTLGFGSFYVNTITYGGLFLCSIPFTNIQHLSYDIWFYGVIGGLLGALGNACLIKALSLGDLSVLGPINAYKAVIAMVLGIFILHEIPSITGILATILIILGSYFIFDTVKEKFTFALLKRKDIQYRFLALLLTGLEALMIKEVIIRSNILISFVMWCGFGFIFSLIFSILKKERFYTPKYKSILMFIGLILMFGLMQITTNYVFVNMNVSYALAFFQLSAIINVLFGYSFFKETHIIKKLIGTAIMILGAVILNCFT